MNANRVSTLLEMSMRDSMRIASQHIKKHPYFVIYFILTVTIGVYLAVFFGIFLHRMGISGADLSLDHGVLGVLFLLFVMGRGSSSTYRVLLRRRQAIWPHSTSSPGEVITAFALELLAFTYLLTSITAIAILAALNSVGVHYFLPYTITAEGMLLLLNGTLMSAYTPILLNIQDRKKRWIHIVLLSIGTSLFLSTVRYWPSVTGRPYSAQGYFAVLGLFAAVNAVVLWYSGRYLREAWNAQVSRASGMLMLRRRGNLPKTPGAAIYMKELRQLMRERDSVATASISIFLAASLVYVYYTHDFTSMVPYGMRKTIYPVMVAVALFLALELQPLLIGLEYIGMEGKKMWIYRATPTMGRDILWGKFLALATVSVPLTLAITLPVPILAGLSLQLTALLAIMGIYCAVIYAAVGIFTGAKYPNMSDSDRGEPDIVTELGVAFLGAFIAPPAIVLPGILYMLYGPPTILLAVIFLGLSPLFARFMTQLAGRDIDAMQSDAYM